MAICSQCKKRIKDIRITTPEGILFCARCAKVGTEDTGKSRVEEAEGTATSARKRSRTPEQLRCEELKATKQCALDAFAASNLIQLAATCDACPAYAKSTTSQNADTKKACILHPASAGIDCDFPGRCTACPKKKEAF